MTFYADRQTCLVVQKDIYVCMYVCMYVCPTNPATTHWHFDLRYVVWLSVLPSQSGLEGTLNNGLTNLCEHKSSDFIHDSCY